MFKRSCRQPRSGYASRTLQRVLVARWLLDPEKPGSWNIAVEAKRDRELVPVAVTTALGFTALWVQAGAFLAGAAAVLFGFFALLRRG
jgi:hypothetical protein